ncbi:MAG: DUF4942 domain-containing protein [Rudaea sp.]|uniref:DUF4942 domain-containing protein n=1 Tax=unclassified Rudaea TaxID=2627037 RepID=UPI0010FA0FC2|nr:MULTISPECIES: DUF4942 domain-containing protein [unclassified Rudaea]MBN8884453.1 DUF4942 domain-containing protein [Rudaea sp.]
MTDKNTLTRFPAGGGDEKAGGITPSVSLADMLEERERHFEIARASIRTLFELPHGPDLFDSRWCRPEQHDELIGSLFERFQISYDCASWQSLMKRSGLWTFMDAEARDAWNKSFNEDEVRRSTKARLGGEPQMPPFTRAAVEEMFEKLYRARGEMVERGIVSLFRSLSWDYRSNSPVAFGQKLVLRNVARWCHLSKKYFGDGKGNELDDVLRTLSLLDGKPEPDYRQSVSAGIAQGILDGEAWRDYFDLKLFRNGNAHVRFKRMDLVDRLNVIIAKHYPGALADNREGLGKARRRGRRRL